MQQQPDDILVIQMILRGEQSAYAVLVNKYQSYVFTLVMRYVHDRELAEELAQDVFIKAYRHLADFKGNSKFSTWLYTVVNSICLSHLRKKKDKTILLEQEQMLLLSGCVYSNENAGDRMEQKGQKEILSKAIACLPPDDAQIITLFYQLEQSLEETGSIMGITANNVKVKLFRARQRLREILETKFINELT